MLSVKAAGWPGMVFCAGSAMGHAENKYAEEEGRAMSEEYP